MHTRARSSPVAKTDLLPAPPWLRVRKVALIRREIREYLPPGAIDLLLAGAAEVIEGAPELGRTAGKGWVYATAMVTIDLQRSRAAVREGADAGTAGRVAELLRDHAHLRARLIERVRPRLAALAGLVPEAIDVTLDFGVRARGTLLLIDADASARARPKRA